jgi:DNA invertase Pin-like site-specific DNA recombinase
MRCSKGRFCGNELGRPCLAHARGERERLGRPITVGLQAVEVQELYRNGVAKAEIARRLQVGRTSVRRILARPDSREREVHKGK